MDAQPADRSPHRLFGCGMRQYGIARGAAVRDVVRERVGAFRPIALSLAAATFADSATFGCRASERRCRR